MSDEIPTIDELKLLRVVDLKKYLVDFGLSTSGNKPDLVQRLAEYYQQQKSEEGDAAAASSEEAMDEEPRESGETKTDLLDEQKTAEDNTLGEMPEAATAGKPEGDIKKEGASQKLSLQFGPPKAHPAGAPPVEDAPPAATRAERSPAKVDAPASPTKAPAVAAPASPVKETVVTSPVKAVAPVSPAKPVIASPPKASGPPQVKAHAQPSPSKSSGPSLVQAPAQPSPSKVTPTTQSPKPSPKVEVKTPPAVPMSPRAAQPVKEPVKPAAALPKQIVYEEEDEEDEEMDEDNGESVPGLREKKNRKKLKKKKKKNRPEMWAMQAIEAQRRKFAEAQTTKSEQDVEVEYIQEELALDPSDPLYRTFNKIFQAFKISEPVPEQVEEQKDEEERKHAEEFKKVPKLLEEDDLIEEKEGDGEPKISKRKLKKLNRLSVAELKQLVSRPDVVEMHDVTARDPRLLVHLKSTRNTVPVPRHWCFKRKYLQGKRGIEKPPFDLPDFIKKTGIMEMREALQEKEDAKGMKAKQREKVRPKLGKIDIDYQKLHDAFFKWQTKPRMTMHGDLYYEGKEFEIRLKEKKPGDLSDDLRTALGMPVGPNAHKVPPPWLIAMQRYGPPPSYPNLKIPGLNAPIPDGCSFGYHAGGWGKPPVDEVGKPLYGDVFGTSDSRALSAAPAEEIDTTLWGEMESESEEETDSEEEEEEEEGEGGEGDTGLQTPVVGDGGMATPSGTTSTIGGAGLETPDMIELRKRRIEADMEGGETPSLPYTILPERRNERIGASMMGSAHTYDIGKARAAGKGRDTAVEMALDPEEIDFDSETMALKAEAALREQQANLAKEDLSDMVAEHAAKQKNKRKRQEAKDEKDKAKKYKEFKF